MFSDRASERSELLGSLGASWGLLERKFKIDDPSRRFGLSRLPGRPEGRPGRPDRFPRPPRLPRQVSQAAQAAQALAAQAAQTGPQAAQTSLQAAKTSVPGRPDKFPRPPRPPRRPQAAQTGPSSRPRQPPSRPNKLLRPSQLPERPPGMRLPIKQCACRQNLATVDTAPVDKTPPCGHVKRAPGRPDRLLDRPDKPPRPPQLLERSPRMCASTKLCSWRQHLVLVDIAPVDITQLRQHPGLLLST